MLDIFFQMVHAEEKEKSSSADNKDFLQNEPYSAAEGMYYLQLLQCLLLEFWMEIVTAI